jgi:putative OPT family oligopeptide transporter
MLAAFLGGVLGVLFLIPLRRFFCAEQHGKLPFPEATATTNILVAGEAGGAQAKVLIWSAMIGGVYDFLATTVKAWNENLTFQWLSIGKKLSDNARMVFKVDAVSFIFGLGYIVGLRYSAVILAGSLLSTFVVVPLIWHFGKGLTLPLYPGTIPIGEMSESVIFREYARRIGIGAIATAGFIGIIKSLPIMLKSFSIGFREIFGKRKSGDAVRRIDSDVKMSSIIFGLAVSILALLLFFTAISSFKTAAIGVLMCVVLSFLFTTVAAYATAIVGTNPVSGMTLATLILTSVILIATGLTGTQGMAVALLIGSVVCTALSVSGGFITDLKIGYWLGTTPRNQERFKFLGILVAAFSVAVSIYLLDKAYPFAEGKLPAPQANLMATIISSLMSQEPIPWILYGIGAAVAILVECAKVPTLAFALGMYLPMELNTPLFFGGLTAYFVQRSTKDEALKEKRWHKGTLIASGFLAGGALMGVLGAILKWLQSSGINIYSAISLGIPQVFKDGKWIDGTPASWYQNYGEIISLIMFVILGLYVYYDCKRVK